MMKRCKWIAPVLITAISCTLLAGCGGTKESKDSEFEPIVLTVGHAQPETTPRHTTLLEFADLVEEKTNGDIKIEIKANSALGTEKEMMEAVKMGSLDIMEGGQLDFLPELLVVTLPFLVSDMDEVTALCTSDFLKDLAANSEKQGLKILAIKDSGGLRNFSNNVRPITKPDDLKDLKMRSNGLKTVDDTLLALGANIMTVPYGDLYMALKTGVADGQENPWININAMKFYEVQKYFTAVDYQFQPAPIYMNLDLFNGLPQEYQDILLECAEETVLTNNQLVADSLDEAKAVVAEHSEIYELSPEERQAFIDACTPVYDLYVGNGADKLITQEQFDEMKEVIASASK